MEPTLTKLDNINELNTMYKALFTYLKDNTDDIVRIWTSDSDNLIEINSARVKNVKNSYFSYWLASDNKRIVIIPYRNITTIQVAEYIYNNLDLD